MPMLNNKRDNEITDKLQLRTHKDTKNTKTICHLLENE